MNHKFIFTTLTTTFFILNLYVPLGAQNTAEDYYTKARNYNMGQNGFPYDQKEAIRYYQMAAEAGHEEAQAYIGEAYLRGSYGLKRDKDKGLKWLTTAAGSGNAGARRLLGYVYQTGEEGVVRDYSKAMEYYMQAFQSPRIDSYSNIAKMYALKGLAEMYEKGQGCEPDMDKAVDFYFRSARLNHSDAQYKIAQLYLEGRNLPKDDAESVIWLKKAALGGQPDAQKLLKKKYKINAFELSPAEQERLYQYAGKYSPKKILGALPAKTESGPSAAVPGDLELSDVGPVAQ